MQLTRLSYLFALVIFTAAATANDRPTLHGVVVNEVGKPVGHATVLIFHAGPKRGYSIYCPSCYADCGKRTITAPDGSFSIHNLDPTLRFELLTVGEGFEPTFVKDVDPAALVAARAVLHARPAAGGDTRGVIFGRIVDDHRSPLRDVVVAVQGLSLNSSLRSQPGKGEETSLYFFGEKKEGLENVAVSNDRGEFQVSYKKPAISMLLKIEGRGFAPKWEAVNTGAHRTTIPLERGAAVRGRLLDHGKPVANAEIGIVPVNNQGFGRHLKSLGDPYDEIRVGTQKDGTFVIADVPTHVTWVAYTKAESMAQQGSVKPVECTTASAADVVDLGDLSVTPGHRLRGKVTVEHAGSLPKDLTVRMFSGIPRDSIAVPVRTDGTFEFNGLPTARYDLTPETRDFHVSAPVNGLLVDRDTGDITIALEAIKK
jgi:hypothetical protein